MRRDVCYFFPADVVRVYNAYLAAASGDKFKRTCKQEPYHTLSFGLNMSFKYNMNGGSCTIHFMPYNNGTAVDLRFSVVQLAGARYGAYAKELTDIAMGFASVQARQCNINVDEFLKEQNKVKANSVNTGRAPYPAQTTPPSQMRPSAPSPVNVPPSASSQMRSPTTVPAVTKTPSPVYAKQPVFATDEVCKSCGKRLMPNAVFCSGCGTKIKEDKKACKNCGEINPGTGNYCPVCGCKI